MIPTAPQIGFDRFIRLDWVAAALKVRAGMANLDELNELLDAAGLGLAARKKTRTVLNRLWLEPRADLFDFANRGAEIFKAHPGVPVPALSWGMAIATYPFFGKVAELVGRLSALQGDCSSAEVHRRMSEIYGEREGIYRMTNRVLQSQAGWGTLERVQNGRRLIRRPPITLTENELVVWLVEAALRYAGRAVSTALLQSMAVLYPFVLNQSLAYLVSNSPHLELRSEGPGTQFAFLRD
ncbi:MAG TPA: hypothetical protein PK752_16865 [Accumulibacter sp.]|uniref:hypothetical protein n=1 Tax=Accumulibacter sp. TaxID=2053492 RepID=UPI002626976E|nr:hypothetical protein [Accumulibacter sp.]HRD89911.1 hypothetical protein [Accumulibacter sp.]